MNTEQIIKAIKGWSAQFEREVDRLGKALERRVKRIQRALFEELRKLIERLEFEGSAVSNSAANRRIIQAIDGVLDRFQRDVINAEMQAFAREIQGVGNLTAQYYAATGFSVSVEDIQELIRGIIGVDLNGNLIRGGYLDRLGRSEEVRQRLRDYVLQSVVSRKSLGEFQRGLKELIQGNEQVDGALVRYWRQYAFDVFNQVHEVANKTLADQLGLQYFIYQGSVIDTTRAFCEKKAGKVFSTEEAKEWKDDPDLIDKKTKDQYNPLLERGRYNCRHFLAYISKEVAKAIRPDIK